MPENHTVVFQERVKILCQEDRSLILFFIDIEGFDIKVLKSINLKFYNPKLICIEILNPKNEIELSNHLMKYGYFFEKKMGPSYLFSNKS